MRSRRGVSVQSWSPARTTRLRFSAAATARSSASESGAPERSMALTSMCEASQGAISAVRPVSTLITPAGTSEVASTSDSDTAGSGLSGAAVRFLKAKSIKTVAFALDPEFGDDGFVSAVIEGAILGDFDPDRYKTSDDKKAIVGFILAADTPGLDSAVERGRVLGEAQNFTRDLVNQPANHLDRKRGV